MKKYSITMYQTLVDSDVFEAETEEKALEMADEELDPEEIYENKFEVTVIEDEDGNIEFPHKDMNFGEYNMCVVFTGNKHGEIIIFQNRRDAKAWMLKATRLSEAEIEDEIRDVTTIGAPDGAVVCFPQQI